METERLEQTTLFSTENPAPLEVKLEPVTTSHARASGDRTLLPPNLHRPVSLAPGLCLSTLLGFVSWTSYLHTMLQATTLALRHEFCEIHLLEKI